MDDDLDARIDAVLAHHKAAEAKRNKVKDASDPHAMSRVITKVFAAVERQQELDRGVVEVKAYEC